MKTLENVLTEIFNTIEEALQVIFTTESNATQAIPIAVKVKKRKLK